MIIRKAMVEDSISIAAVAIAVWIDAYAEQGMDKVYSRYVLGRFNENNVADLVEHKHVYVAESEFGICGFTVMSGERDGVYEIETMYVLNRFRSHGIGLSLVKTILDNFSGRFWLKCAESNPRALSFYRRNAFTETGRVNFTLDGKKYPCILFEKVAYESVTRSELSHI